MARTTINLNDELFKSLKNIAKRENRSAPNLIETILMRYLEDDFFVDEFEMQDIHEDKELKATIQKSLNDYKKRKGRFV